jgi:hypothetical protein
VEITDVTTIRGPEGLWRRLGRPLRERSGPPSLRAQLVLIVAAILFGAVLSGFLFVGVWRHTAAQGDAAHAAQVATSRRLHVTQARLAAIRAQVASVHAQAARERRQIASPLASVVSNAATLQHQLAKLNSELSSIGAYLASASATGVDPAFVAAQVRYLTSSAGAAEDAVAALSHQASLAQAAAGRLNRKP